MKVSEKEVSKSILLIVLSVVFIVCILLLNFNDREVCIGDECKLLNGDLMHGISSNIIDDEIKKYMIQLNNEEIIPFINSSDSFLNTSSLLHGAMYNSNINIDYKIYYSLYRLLNNASMINNVEGKLYISKDMLNNVVNLFFGNVQIKDDYKSLEKYYFINGVSCLNGVCEISYKRIESTGYDSTYVSKIVSDSIVGGKREIIVEIYYVTIMPSDNGNYRLIISADKGFPAFVELEISKEDVALKKYYDFDYNRPLFDVDELFKYKYVFNDNNQLEIVYQLKNSTIIDLEENM